MFFRNSTLAVAGALLMLPAVAAAAHGQDQVSLQAVRFYRADQEQTRVKAFVQIPYRLLEPTAGSPGGQLSYEVRVRIADTMGLTLHEESWAGHAPAAARYANAYALEILEFPLAAGKYLLEMTVTDSVTGRQHVGEIELAAFETRPSASDLLLSPQIRVVSEEDSVPRAGEFRFGDNTVVTAAVELVLTPLRTKAFYLLEAYSEDEASGTMAVSILTEAGKVMVRTPPSTVKVPAGGGVLKGQLDLAGLPEGTYQMRVALTLGDHAVERSRPFQMRGLRETLVMDSIRRAAARETDEGYFAAMNEAELDDARAPLLYIAKAKDNLKIYDDLSVAAKSKLLAQFWQQRDPTPGTEKNEAREQFYAAISYANEQFTEPGRRGRVGWRTDRGRIFAGNGMPEDILSRTRSGFAPPYDVWRYSRGKSRYYIFADRTGLGNYQLVHSNDLKEASRPDWLEILTDEAVIDVSLYLGVDFLRESSQNPRF